ncbi:MAG: hypothetical protein LC797_08155 [Chloroflexi bacterium]|nr:hypothetical protein [Chloroflexota bacterium]
MYGVSIDLPFVHAAYRTQLELPDGLVLLSDFNREFERAYGILTTNAAGLKTSCGAPSSWSPRRKDHVSVGQYRSASLPRANDVLAALRA